LRNAVEHAVVLCRGGQLLPEHLPRTGITALTDKFGNSNPDLPAALSQWIDQQLPGQPEDLYAQAIRMLDSLLLPEILSRTGQNRTAAARILGMDRTTLRSRLRELDPIGEAD
jgi:DNA-binding NtrC family response regulator